MLRIKTIPRKTLCANLRSNDRWGGFVPGSVDRGALEADAPLGVGGGGVFEETGDGVRVCLVDEEAAVFGGVLDLECPGAMDWMSQV